MDRFQYDSISFGQSLIGHKFQCFGRNSQYVILLQCINRHGSRQSRFQFQIRIRCTDHHFVGHHIRFHGSLQPYLSHNPFERIVPVGIYGKGNPLSFAYFADIGLIHVCNHLHLRQIFSNGKQSRSFESGSHRLSFFHFPTDNDTIYRTGNHGIPQISSHLYNIGFRLFIGTFSLFIIIRRLFIIAVADQLLFEQHFTAGIIFLLILVFCFGIRQLSFLRFQFCL